jgi:hypothetical protein
LTAANDKRTNEPEANMQKRNYAISYRHIAECVRDMNLGPEGKEHTEELRYRVAARLAFCFAQLNNRFVKDMFMRQCELKPAKPVDKPEDRRTYVLTGGPDVPCIAQGNTWKESEVQETPTGVEDVKF